MPELPEVEEVRRTLEPHLLNVRIAEVQIRRRDFVTQKKANVSVLTHLQITRTLRHGKKLFLIAGDSGPTLLFHLGMSGRIDAVPAAAPFEKHTHFVIDLASKTQIRFRDPRRFGGVWFYPTLAAALAAEVENKLGPDALEVTIENLAHWKNSKGRLKQRLLAQRDVAGLGNIYVDEALWMSKLHPQRLVAKIPPASLNDLVAAIHKVLTWSINSGGTTLRDYRNVADQPGDFARQLQAYGRAGLPCNRCGNPLKQVKIASRTTVFCPICQRQR